RAVHRTQIRPDTDARQILHIGLKDTLQSRVYQQDFEAQGAAFSVGKAVFRKPLAGFGEPRQGGTQGGSWNASTLGSRQMEGLGEYLGRQLLAITREQQPLGAFRQPAGSEVAVRVVAFAASIGLVEQCPIGPFEIEQ